MMIQAVVVIIGACVVLGSFIAALVNMGKAADPETSFDEMFKTHLTTMGSMAVGTFMVIGGSLWYLFTHLPT